MSEPGRTRRHDGGAQPMRNRQRADFVTLEPELSTVFIVWREGARMPQSFHATEAEAVETAGARFRPGQIVKVLRAELIGTIEVPLPRIRYIRSTGR